MTGCSLQLVPPYFRDGQNHYEHVQRKQIGADRVLRAQIMRTTWLNPKPLNPTPNPNMGWRYQKFPY